MQIVRVAVLGALCGGLLCGLACSVGDFGLGAVPENDSAVEDSDAGDGAEIVNESDTIDSGDADSPPETDTGCPVHVNGVGGTYTYCAPLGVPGSEKTYSLAMAVAARASAMPVGAATGDIGCGASAGIFFHLPTDASAGPSTVWAYTGPLAGHLRVLADWKTGTAGEACPSLSDPTWD